MQKVKAETKILTDCLATTKVSNVVKQNDNLLEDHTVGCEKLHKLNIALKKDLMTSESLVPTLHTASNKKKLDQLETVKGSLSKGVNEKDFPDGQRL